MKKGATREPRSPSEHQKNFIEETYERVLPLMEKAIDSGKSNTVEGLIGLLGMFELLHGGAYAAPMNKRPYFMKNPKESKWYAGDVQNQYSQGLLGFLAQAFSGQNGSALADEVLVNANVPHVLPKLISDEAYAMFRLLFAQASTTQLFQQAGTGLKSYTDAASTVIGAARGFRGGEAASDTAQYEAETARLKSMLGKEQNIEEAVAT